MMATGSDIRPATATAKRAPVVVSTLITILAVRWARIPFRRFRGRRQDGCPTRMTIIEILNVANDFSVIATWLDRFHAWSCPFSRMLAGHQ